MAKQIFRSTPLQRHVKSILTFCGRLHLKADKLLHKDDFVLEIQ